MREKSGEVLRRKQPTLAVPPPRKVCLHWSPTLVFLAFLLDVLQEGSPGIHNRFEGIFAAGRYALVGVQQHGQLPVRFVDFVPRKEAKLGVSGGGGPTHRVWPIGNVIIARAVSTALPFPIATFPKVGLGNK